VKRTSVTVKRKHFRFLADETRVITRPFLPGGLDRFQRIIDRVARLTDADAARLLDDVMRDFSKRHRNIENVFRENFQEILKQVGSGDVLSNHKQLLIGSYFTMEYSIESAALFNPSIVLSCDQKDLRPGHARVILSFRATGEGHVSSLEFRSATVTDQNELILDPLCSKLGTPKQAESMFYDNNLFGLQLIEMSVPEGADSSDFPEFLQSNDVLSDLLGRLPESFTLKQLEQVMAQIRSDGAFDAGVTNQTLDRVQWFACSNYEVRFGADTDISERILFPLSDNERRGIEDARFVRFADGDEQTYYATYSAFDGNSVQVQLLETKDFLTFKVSTLNGKHANSKGMALFPRKIGGQYAMISRVDGENLFLMYSHDIRFWHVAHKIQEPDYPWEFVQIGNCGSPIETEAGWLLLTHGVGPMRRYCLGATLLDLVDPSKILGHLPEPLLAPNAQEREGYVPNVVYTCGALIHNGELIIPYAMSDSASTVATVSVADLLGALLVR